MNRQGKKQKDGQWLGGIEWARVNGRPGFTWNVVQGCLHDCKWRMADGTVAECYAKTVAVKFKSDKFFPNGFDQHYFNLERLDEPTAMEEPAGIFLDSVADLMGHWVPDYQINQVLDVCRKADWHIFQLLTKNAPRLLKFDLPTNLWAGVSAPPTFFMGKELSMIQQRQMVLRQLDVLAVLKAKGHPVCWMSIEPLSFDIADVFRLWMCDGERLPLDWAVIGAASNGPKYYQPKREHTESVHAILRDRGCRIFHKGNLDWTPHLEEFPILPESPKPTSTNLGLLV